MKKVCLPGIARTCDKIESVLTRKVVDLAAHFKKIDPEGRGMISDTKFFVVMYNQLGHELGLCQEEVKELGKYFKKENGCICYEELLKLVTPTFTTGKPLVTCLEWEDHKQVSVISPFECRQLKLILTKIAHSCRTRSVCLKALFEVRWT